jgi:CDP-6-deoxy-D-xylo-4-hexulose-3-dehydrase
VREELEALARRVLKTPPAFVPGETFVPVTAPVYGVEELVNGMEAVLEFKPAAGRWASKLEMMLSKQFNVHAARLTNSGSSANLLAVAAMNAIKGSEVITVAAAFPTTVAPLVQHGLTPVFVDVDPTTANVDVTQLEAALSPWTCGVMLAHTLGNPFNIDAVLAFCTKHNLWLIEDACDAFGATWRGQPVGSFGNLATLSFYPAHHMTTGEGGVVLCRSENCKAVTSLRDWGRSCWCDPGADGTCGNRFGQTHGSLPDGYDHKYVYSHLGYSLRMTDMQAAIGVAQMARMPAGISARRENWNALHSAFSNFDFDLILPSIEAHANPSPFGFLISVDPDAKFTRNEIVQHLERHKIATRPLFAGNLTRHPAMAKVNFRTVGKLTNTDFLMNNAFWIGVHPGITPEMRGYMIEVVRDFVMGAQ